MPLAKRRQAAGIMLELLVACLLLSLMLPLILNSLRDMRLGHIQRQAYQQSLALKSAIDAHLRSQWSRLKPAHCVPSTEALLTITQAQHPPQRLANKNLAAGSDGLLATDVGLCRVSTKVTNNPIKIAVDCHWKAGDAIEFASCEGITKGQVVSVSGDQASLSFADNQLLGESGVIASQDRFYWYLAEGKAGNTALWRTPAETGSALELWSGIERLSIFPLLDTQQDSLVDSLNTEYGEYSMASVRALWVEYQYRVEDCQWQAEDSAPQEYVSMRGQTWQYRPPCQQVTNQIIDLQGF
ncbi:hypothetical protein [Marinomonas sp. THO17]|uniref:hypothetical protein n=1 Tax=Marinomonas sp. THO17 TaxID=3149048 RepID=UPI00336BCF7D